MSCCAGGAWAMRVGEGHGQEWRGWAWEGAGEGKGCLNPPGNIGGVTLLSPLQMPAPHQPSCHSHQAAGSTCRLHTTSATQHLLDHQPPRPPRGRPWPLLSLSPHPTTAWRVPWARGAAAAAPSAGRSPLPPVLRTTTRLTVPGAGPGRWKTNIPSTEPPVPGGWMARGCGAPVPLTAAPACLLPCHHQQPS